MLPGRKGKDGRSDYFPPRLSGLTTTRMALYSSIGYLALRPPLSMLDRPMPPVVIELRSAEDWRDVVHQAVQALAEGKLVAFPTETVYGIAASALDERGVRRLVELKGRRRGHALTPGGQERRRGPRLRPRHERLAQRLARRCWPGPVTLVVDDVHPESLRAAASAAPSKSGFRPSGPSGCACRGIRSCWTCCGCWPARWS